MNKLSIAIAAALVLASSVARADCAISASTATHVQVIDQHILVLWGGAAGAIMIKSFEFFYPTSQIGVLKDSFCDFATDVIALDGRSINVQEVKQVH